MMRGSSRNNKQQRQQEKQQKTDPIHVDTVLPSTSTIRIAICGLGEIATKAHVPAILKYSSSNISSNSTNILPHHPQPPLLFRLVAVVEHRHHDKSLNKKLNEIISKLSSSVGDDQQEQSTGRDRTTSIEVYRTFSNCLEEFGSNIDAVSICTPPSVTLDLAEVAIRAGKHVLIEKPPGPWKRLRHVHALAEERNVTFFTAYHTAACVGLHHAQEWIKNHIHTTKHDHLRRVHVIWKESVRKWHPGQLWVTKKKKSHKKTVDIPEEVDNEDDDDGICEGVLDMVFNPLSLLVQLFKGHSLEYGSSHLLVPSNWETPISGRFRLLLTVRSSLSSKEDVIDAATTTTTTATTTTTTIPVTGDFAWDYEPEHDNTNNDSKPEEIWKIVFESSTSTVVLSDGGSQVDIDGRRVTTQPTAAYPLEPEYENLYRQFASFIAQQTSAVDDTTPRLLQEIQDRATRTPCPPYEI